jgi:hypothetical protein
VHVSGTHFNGAKRVTAWLKGDTPEQATIVNSYLIDHVPYAVKVGDVSVQPDGSFQLDFQLKAVMEPVSTGGRLLVVPGEDLTIVLVDDAYGGGTRGMGFQVGEGCPSSPLPSSASLRLEPAYPCFGEAVTAIGQGFQGPGQQLEFHLAETRFNMGPSQTVEVPVAADGSFHYTFRLEDLKNLSGTAEQARDTRYFLYAFDAANNRKLTVPMPLCNPELEQALEAPSIAFQLGMQGTIDLSNPGSPVPEPSDESESTVVRSQADLDAFGARHHMKPEAIALLPKLDYAKEQGIMVLSGRHWGSESVEVVGIERLGDRDLVHAVVWRYPSPMFGPAVIFHFAPMPKSDRAVQFAPLAYGFSDQREFLAPALATRVYPTLYSGPFNAPRVTTN